MGRNWKFLFLYGLGLPPRLARAAAITNCFTSGQLRFLTLLCWIFMISFSHLLTTSNLCNNEYYHLGRQKGLLKFYGENIILCLQMVLAHVTNKLSSHVTYLTVQVFKDDWIRSSSGSKLNIPSLQHSTPHNMPYLNQGTKTIYSSPQQFKATLAARGDASYPITMSSPRNKAS